MHGNSKMWIHVYLVAVIMLHINGSVAYKLEPNLSGRNFNINAATKNVPSYIKFILIFILGYISNIVKTIIYRASFIQTHPICNKTRLESNRKTSVLGSLPSATLKVSHMEFKHVRLRSSNVLLNGSGSQINKVRNGCFKTKV